MKLNVDKVFIIHLSTLQERRVSLEEQLEGIENEVEWITEEPENYDFICDEMDLVNKKIAFLQARPILPPRRLVYGEKSLMWKHAKFYELFKQQNLNSALVLEDDVVFDENFADRFNSYLSKTPHDADLVYPGNGKEPEFRPSPTFHIREKKQKVDVGLMRADSIIFFKNAVEKISSTLLPCSLPYDWELNFHAELHKLVPYFWEPGIIKQGSKCGKFQTAIKGRR